MINVNFPCHPLLLDDSETKQLSQMEGNALAGSHSVSSDASRTDGFDDSARSRTSSSEMSSDSLEGEEETRGNHDGVNRQLCAALSNVKIDYKQVITSIRDDCDDHCIVVESSSFVSVIREAQGRL